MGQYQQIGAYLEYLARDCAMHVCVKDYIGFIPINKDLDRVLNPYVAHTNPYCMYVKQDRQQYSRCLSMIRPMYAKCYANPQGFWGICYAGVNEWVLPVRLGEEVLGSLNIGCFPGQEELSTRLRRRLFRGADAETERTGEGLFTRYMQPPPMRLEELQPSLALMAEYLGQTYRNFQHMKVGAHRPQVPRMNSEDTIISHAIEYIRHNYAMKISVHEIAQACHCSESYINHTFRKRTGVTVNTYINKARVEYAKNYLLSTTNRISDIAFQVGFSDPNYFSRVFTELLDITPREFRRRFTT